MKKNDYTERYSKIVKSDWFLKTYKDKNLDDAIPINFDNTLYSCT